MQLINYISKIFISYSYITLDIKVKKKPAHGHDGQAYFLYMYVEWNIIQS